MNIPSSLGRGKPVLHWLHGKIYNYVTKEAFLHWIYGKVNNYVTRETRITYGYCEN